MKIFQERDHRVGSAMTPVLALGFYKMSSSAFILLVDVRRIGCTQAEELSK